MQVTPEEAKRIKRAMARADRAWERAARDQRARAEHDLWSRRYNARRKRSDWIRSYVDRTVMPTAVDRDLSARLAVGVEITRRCHRNAIAVLRAHPELRDRLCYVEGNCTGTDSAARFRNDGYAHSWLMTVDGVIVEVTPDYENSVPEDYFPARIWGARYATSRAGRELAGTLWNEKGRAIEVYFRSMRAARARHEEKKIHE